MSDCVTLRGVLPEVMQATLLKDGSPVKLTTRGENAVLTIPPDQREIIDTVIRLER